MTSEQRTVLSPVVGREEFQDLALLSGWQLHTVVQPDESRPYEEIWTADYGTSSAHYVEDYLLGVASVVTMGDRAAELAEFVAQNLSTLTQAEVLVWVYAVVDDPGQRVQALGYLAAVAPPQAADAFLAVLEDALHASQPEVRQAALYACVYLSWPEVVPLVEAVHNGDPDETTRFNAAQVLEAIRRHQNPAS
ncbi:HEAT repeat domain-containing protein [Amycolatopsis sp. WGS_07]|uniref:HEAT repeat domain-containing protein n=1 Tax=Amycolatopsis sp. WGS_07 TaxID=3076764 RepID=UPI0038739372